MIRSIFFLFAIILFSTSINAQNDSTFVSINDTTELSLEEVVVKGFEQNRRLKDVPAAVNYVSPQTFNRFSSASIVAAVNTTPGIRMEERSPGSYRINIRGSSLRSPFGVRNVKIYYNDIPYTDPGGNSYLNNLGYYNINSLEIIKGPSSSLYGPGTGGVMMIESLNENAVAGVTAEYTGGSYNLSNAYGALTTNNDKTITRLSYQRQKNDGYRNQSGLQRDVAAWNGIFKLDDKKQIKASFLYSDLEYETPGAQTLAEYNANPKGARPNAEQVKAAVSEKTFVAGASYWQQLASKLENKTTLYAMFTDFNNPNLRGYDRSTDPHAGGRTVFTFKQPADQSLITINVGAELQQGFTKVATHKNVGGNADSLRSSDNITNRQSFVFGQAALDVADWTFTAGASWNQLKVRFQRFTLRASGEQVRKFDNEIAPRFSVLKKIDNISIYSSVSKGFSTPTSAELFPTGGTVNFGLNAEDGVNYDLGFRGNFFKRLYVDVNAFLFSLNNTIVVRKDAFGGDFYINAGKTKQRGVETQINYSLFTTAPFLNRSSIWLSHTWHKFEYKSFKQGDDDFSGKKMPAEAPHTIAAGFDILANNGLSALLTYYYSDKLPLNDANTAYAKEYNLLGLKLGYEKLFNQKFRVRFFAGADNLLDEKYSLGNDINGFGGRFYNAAPGRNYYGGITLSCEHKRS